MLWESGGVLTGTPPVQYCFFVTHVELKEFLVQSVQGLDIVVVFIQCGEDIIQSNVHPQASHQLPWVTLQGTYNVGEKVQSWHPVWWYTVKSQCQLWYLMASLVSSSLKTGRLIFIWPPGSLWSCQPWCGCLEPPNPSDIDATDEEVHAELLSLSNPWSDESEGDWGGATHNSCCLWPQSQPHCGTWPCSWCMGWGPSLGTSHHSAAAGKFAGCRDKSWLQKLNGVEAGGMEQGWPDPLDLIVLQWWFGWSTAGHHPGSLVWHWVGLVCQPNWWCLTAWTWCLVPHPRSVLLLTTGACRTGLPDLGWSLWLLFGQLCHLKPCLPQLAPAMHEMVVVPLSSLVEVTCISKQYQVSG